MKEIERLLDEARREILADLQAKVGRQKVTA